MGTNRKRIQYFTEAEKQQLIQENTNMELKYGLVEIQILFEGNFLIFDDFVYPEPPEPTLDEIIEAQVQQRMGEKEQVLKDSTALLIENGVI